MEFAPGGPEGLALLASNPVDVVVTDMRMPSMDGAQFLTEVRERYPQTVRIVLTGQSSREAMLRAVRVAHRHLSKPCDAGVLRSTVQSACALRELLADNALYASLSRLNSVPSPPAMYLEVVKELESPEPSLEKVGRIIEQDVGMTAKILQMVHSAFFGVRAQVRGPAQAVLFLGSETTKVLVLAGNIFSQMDAKVLKSFALDALWAHSQTVSRLAAAITRSQQCEQRVIQEARMAGLIHDTGKLILASCLPDRYGEVLLLARRENLSVAKAERQLFGATHAEIGAYLLALWGLPDSLVEPVAWHHRPNECPAIGFTPLTAVHVANALAREGDPDLGEDEGDSLHMAYLERIGLAERLSAWRALRDSPDNEDEEP